MQYFCVLHLTGISREILQVRVLGETEMFDSGLQASLYLCHIHQLASKGTGGGGICNERVGAEKVCTF